MANFRQGEDLVVELVAIDDNNNKVSLSNLESIVVAFVIKDAIVYKYTDVTTAGYGDLIIDPFDDSKLSIFVTREQSKTFPIGELTASIGIVTPDTALSGITDELPSIVVGNVLKGVLKDDLLI